MSESMRNLRRWVPISNVKRNKVFLTANPYGTEAWTQNTPRKYELINTLYPYIWVEANIRSIYRQCEKSIPICYTHDKFMVASHYVLIV
jgi:hypothetical protein